MNKQEAENLLAQAVALNIIAETCSLYCYCKSCPFFYTELDECILKCSEDRQFHHIKEMESQALSILNNGKNDFSDTHKGFIDWIYDKAQKYYCGNYQFCTNCEFSQYKHPMQKCHKMTTKQKREILIKIYESEGKNNDK